MELHPIPTHPDGAAGLGYLEVVQTYFIPLVVAFSAVESASLAEQIVSGAVPFETIYPTHVVILLVDAALFLGPLFFMPKLWACWAERFERYMSFAARYVRPRQEMAAWRSPSRGTPVGHTGLAALADLSNSVNIIFNMKRVSASLLLLMGGCDSRDPAAVSAQVPHCPIGAEIIREVVRPVIAADSATAGCRHAPEGRLVCLR